MILHSGKVIGLTTRWVLSEWTDSGSGDFGYTIGKFVAFGYVPVELLKPGQPLDFEIEVYGVKYPAQRKAPLNESLYDPERVKILS